MNARAARLALACVACFGLAAVPALGAPAQAAPTKAVPVESARGAGASGASAGITTEIETQAPPHAAYGEELAAEVPAADVETAPAEEPPAAREPGAEGGAEPGAPPSPDELFDPAAPSDEDLAAIDDAFLDEELGPDPAERDNTPHWNRRVFAFNEGFIRWVMRPISRAYQAVLPEFLREMVARGFDNLESPVIFANDMMQLDPCRAGRTITRFVLNTTVGIAGTFDVASEMGLPRHDTDFGETLGRWGVRSGSFLMLPVLGPSTARDTLGELVDTALRPEIWLLGGFPQLALTGGDGLSTYDIQAERLDALRDTSIDFYAALRSAYLMDRDAKIEALRDSGRCRIGKKTAEVIWGQTPNDLRQPRAAGEVGSDPK
jgi:phospholipid-binding lipoprotein MlaA